MNLAILKEEKEDMAQVESNQDIIDRRFLKMAFLESENSVALRLKVGAIVVKDERILGNGFNRMPINSDTIVCELEKEPTSLICEKDEDEIKRLSTLPMESLESKKEVEHAEVNAITHSWVKNCTNATIYVTHSPCKECAKKIISSKIRRVVYSIDYRSLDGIKMLNDAGIKVDKIEICDF